MESRLFKPILLACFVVGFSQASSSRHLDLHVGLSPSKSSLGIGIGDEIREFTVGLKNQPLEWFATRDVILQPGISYNHHITWGFYASATYAPVFVRFGEEGPYDLLTLSRRNPLAGEDYWLKDGWNAGEIFVGLGRTFRFNRFGITLDGNLISPATEDLARSWSYWIGLGISYRFRESR
jgi:hypothetical protein